MDDKKSGDLVKNRTASFNYEILETFESGIVLKGTEIKSLRDHGGNLQEAYIKVVKDELWLVGCSIAPYRFGNIQNHEEKRERKLLMHKREINELKDATQKKGLTVIPLNIYLKAGKAKLKIAICRGKKLADKRSSIKERDQKREVQRAIKQNT